MRQQDHGGLEFTDGRAAVHPPQLIHEPQTLRGAPDRHSQITLDLTIPLGPLGEIGQLQVPDILSAFAKTKMQDLGFKPRRLDQCKRDVLRRQGVAVRRKDRP